jgi:uncharacterized metal-binding protein YceD (DUF177 family)
MIEPNVDQKRQAPWIAPIRLDEVSESGRHIKLRADQPMLAQLATYTGLRSVASAEASFEVKRQGRDGLRVTGEVRARVVLTCVVSLEPMESDIVEEVDVVFKPVIESPTRTEKTEVDAAAEHDPPEPLVNGTVDLGALATEFLILGIDPYPRKPEAVFEAAAAGTGDDGPFAALAKLKGGDGKDK